MKSDALGWWPSRIKVRMHVPVAQPSIYESDFDNALTSCVGALSSGDYGLARQYLAKARIFFSVLPDGYEVAGRIVERSQRENQKKRQTRLRDLEQTIDAHERAMRAVGDLCLVPIGFGKITRRKRRR